MPTSKQWVSFSHALTRLFTFEPFLQSHVPTGTGLILLAEYPDFHGHRVKLRSLHSSGSETLRK